MELSSDVTPASVPSWNVRAEVGREGFRRACFRNERGEREKVSGGGNRGGGRKSRSKSGRKCPVATPRKSFRPAPPLMRHFRGGPEVALFCSKMAAGMYLEHYLDSKRRLQEGVRAQGGGIGPEEISGPPKARG